MRKKSQVQDDKRERIVSDILKLDRTGVSRGSPYDSYDERDIKYQIKCATSDSVAMYSKCSREKLDKLYEMDMHWIFTIGDSYNNNEEYDINDMYFLRKEDMMKWFDTVSAIIRKKEDFIDALFRWDIIETLDADDKHTFLLIRKNGTLATSLTLNWKYVKENGIPMFEPYDEDLRKILKDLGENRPIKRKPTLEGLWM